MAQDPETKLRTLAAADATLQAIFGTPLFRWSMYGQLPQGYIKRGTCARIRRVGTQSDYAQEGPVSLERVRFQFDVMDLDPTKTFPAVQAIAAWLQTVTLMQIPSQAPNFQIDQRSWIESLPEGEVYVQMVGWRIMNDSTI